MEGWYTRHPQWFAAEMDAIRRVYPLFRLDEGLLVEKGVVVLYGELVVRPPGGAKRHPVRVFFPDNSPYAFPSVTPIVAMPLFDEDGVALSHPNEQLFDHRHQMPTGSLCLFQYETRTADGGQAISVVDVLKRAEAWFMGHATGRWPPDSHQSELQSHFYRSEIGILLSKTFYSDRLRGYGEFFAVRDLHRAFIGRSHDEPPLIMTAATVASGVYEVVDARTDLEHIFPWLTNEAWSPQTFIEFQERQRQVKQVEFGDVSRINGHWWELTAEPEVFRDGKGLLAVLSDASDGGDAWPMVSKALGANFAVKERQYIALRYPGRAGRREWLFLVVKAGGTTSQGAPALLTEDQKRVLFEGAPVACVPAHGLTPQDIALRNETVISKGISERKVAFFGVGALGSKVAELLAQAGLSHFVLCDGDILHVGNVARHIGGLSECGAPKTSVVARRIWEVNPYAEIKLCSEHICPTANSTAVFFSGVDLIVCTIADEGAEAGFNDLAIAIKTPVIYGRAMRRGQMGRVFLVRPGLDACKSCLSIAAHAKEPDWITVTERPEDALLHECGRPVIAGSAVDLSFIAALIARQALNVLEGTEVPTNHWVWSRDGAGDLSDKLELPYSVAHTAFAPKPNCPSCSPAKILSVELPDAVRAAMIGEVESSPTTETGGILIGRIEGSRAIVARATGPGPKAIRTATRFERDIEFAQNELDAEVANGNSNIYIGEWHSHLVTLPEPSGRDVLSMKGIAEAPNYATDCPVMVICGFDKKTGAFGKIEAWVFPIASSMRKVTIVAGIGGNEPVLA